ncbi:MAG: Rrf2 family transcriptional regulator [Gemmatimonadetes bacterium]|nr:Rrf2 family transcriptional regulator [Gemmatimonadota bacterium]
MPTISSRFAVAVHLLAYMTWRRSEPVTSERVAGSVNTNPVVVRRIVGALRNAGLVSVQPGVGGGAQLARDPEGITLLDVYRAVEDDALFALHAQPPCGHCDVGGNIQGVLQEVFARASRAMEAELEGVTILQVFESVFARVRARCPQGAEEGALRRPA